jgi:hypothetical protein
MQIECVRSAIFSSFKAMQKVVNFVKDRRFVDSSMAEVVSLSLDIQLLRLVIQALIIETVSELHDPSLKHLLVSFRAPRWR